MGTSTLPPVGDAHRVHRARTLRRVGLVLLAAFVLAGATGVLGTRTSETTVRGGGYELSVTYPRISRPGHAVRVQVEVHRAGGFGEGPVRLLYGTEYFQMFDENAFTPQADSMTADETSTVAEFSAPPGEVFVATVDTRVEPARQRGEEGAVSVLGEDGQPLLTAEFSTWIWP